VNLKSHFLELVLSQDATRVLASRSRFGAEAGGPSGQLNWHLSSEVSRRDRVVKLHFAGGREPESCLNLKRSAANFATGRRRAGGAVDEERRKNFCIAVLGCMSRKKFARARSSRAPILCTGEARPSDFRGRGEIENPCALTNFQWVLRRNQFGGVPSDGLRRFPPRCDLPGRCCAARWG